MDEKNNKNVLMAGVDEVGRGPLAGAVVAACVILDPESPIEGLKDSKKLTAKKREQLAIIIAERSLSYGIGRAEVAEIDSLNILQASLLAMRRSIDAMKIKPDKIMVDGNQVFDYPIAMESVVKGDSLIPAISAASILAKVVRDSEMMALDDKYPEYGFKSHKGYPTKQHMAALREFGATPIHRLSFAPVKAVLEMETETC